MRNALDAVTTSWSGASSRDPWPAALRSPSLPPVRCCIDLIRIGGMMQTPCLMIDGKAMYESDDIIEWLKENYKR